MTIRVLLVDDEVLVRDAVENLLGAFEEIEVVGGRDNGAGIVEAALELRPDVVLMDLEMPVVDGIEATKALRRMDAPPEVVVLTAWRREDAVLQSLEAGASGFLEKRASPEEFRRAVRAAEEGDSFMSPRSTRELIESFTADAKGSQQRRARARIRALTPRELEVAKLVPSGATNGEIGERLHLSPATVKQYVSAIADKLGVTGRIQIATILTRAGYGPDL